MAEKSGLDISISIFVRYRELNSVKYDAEQGRFKIEVALKGLIKDSIMAKFEDKIYSSINLYHNLSNIKPLLLDVEYTNQAGITIISFYRDVKSLNEAEIELFVLMLRDNFPNMLIIDDTNVIDSEETYAREIKRNLLHNHKIDNSNSRNFFGYRDHGTMFVFNK